MAAGLKVFKENGQLLFDTEKITYGLLKSGYMTEQIRWPRLALRSAQLPPSEPGSYDLTNPMDPMYGFSVTGAVAPIVFINGSGVSCGSSQVGDTTTFYYLMAGPDTKFYYFDTMRNTMFGAGLKCYDPSGNLTFNSLQYPLNIVARVQAPPPANQSPTGGWGVVYQGGVRGWDRKVSDPSTPWYYTCRSPISIGAGNFAASITFSRSFGGGAMSPSTSHPGGLAPAYSNLMTYMDGCWGSAGGVYFMSCDAARTTMYISSSSTSLFFDIPLVYPTALVINADNYPFPFN
ncbi:hypothetical protein VA602_18105 [Pseudomonas sp. MH2]|uniref:Virion structural protein n=1 Tax=Pseudomonas machongensis TaxID=3110229 RepID=A0ABU5VKC1_9PSED|nr:hypothetical protein [Pseudomonas sp. MH2]MEA5673238.1 hypothetical protein [Pseudomonas sp. MH2]